MSLWLADDETSLDEDTTFHATRWPFTQEWMKRKLDSRTRNLLEISTEDTVDYPHLELLYLPPVTHYLRRLGPQAFLRDRHSRRHQPVSRRRFVQRRAGARARPASRQGKPASGPTHVQLSPQ